MWLLTLSLLWMALVAWLILRAITQYGAYQQLHAAALPTQPSSVNVIVPARNEESNIPSCLRGLQRQDYPPEQMRITVVDDASTDSTPRIVSSLARSDPRLNLLPGAALPNGWTGKSFACWQGAQACPEAEWLCFIDADVTVAANALTAAIGAARAEKIDMLSLEPFQILGTFWERVIIPAGFFLLAFSQDLRRVNDPAMPDAFANGQFILIRRDIYLAIGGHAAVRGEIAEDSALAKRVKHSGHRLKVLGAEGFLQTRMYISLTSLWEGISKNLLEMVGGAGMAFFFAAAAIVLVAAALALPLWAWHALVYTSISWMTIVAVIAATLASLAIFGVHIGGAVYFRIPFWVGLLFPLGYLMGSALALSSVRQHFHKRVAWKGRSYPTAIRQPS